MGRDETEDRDVVVAASAQVAYRRARRELCAAFATYARALAAVEGTPGVPLRYFACGHAPGKVLDIDGEVVLDLCPACEARRSVRGHVFTEVARLLLGPREPSR